MRLHGSSALFAAMAPITLLACGGSLVSPSGAGGASGVGGVGTIGGRAGSGPDGGAAGSAGAGVSTGAGGSLIIGTGGGPPASDWPLGQGCQNCIKSPINQAFWEPLEVAMVSLPLASTEDYRAAVAALLAPYHPRDRTAGAFGPGAPHQLPRQTELRDLLARAGLNPGQDFSPSEAGPARSILILMTVGPGPDAPVGRSPDSDVGPIIPNELFPMRVDFRPAGPQIWDTFDAKVPRYDAYDPPIVADGASHFVVAFRANSDFDVNDNSLQGRYQIPVRIMDRSGAGWDAVLNFTIWDLIVP